MVTLAHPATEEHRTPRTAATTSARPRGASVMLMGVGGRLALVAGGIAAVWTSLALALS